MSSNRVLDDLQHGGSAGETHFHPPPLDHSDSLIPQTWSEGLSESDSSSQSGVQWSTVGNVTMTADSGYESRHDSAAAGHRESDLLTSVSFGDDQPAAKSPEATAHQSPPLAAAGQQVHVPAAIPEDPAKPDDLSVIVFRQVYRRRKSTGTTTSRATNARLANTRRGNARSATASPSMDGPAINQTE